MYLTKLLPVVWTLVAIALFANPASAFSIQNDGLSEQKIIVVGHKFTSPAKWRGKLNKCAKGTFYDPRKGGQCWSCPKNHKRTVFAVTSNKACQKKGQVVFGGYTKATYKKSKCPRGAFQNGLYNQCYSCPTGFRRSTKIAVDLTKVKDACIANSHFYKTIKVGKKVTGDEKKPVNNVKLKPTTRLSFSVYSADRKCGWHSAPKKAGKTPGLNPTQKACHLISFSMAANETAVIRATNINFAIIFSRAGKHNNTFCNPHQPPNHSTGGSCRRSEAQIDQYQY